MTYKEATTYLSRERQLTPTTLQEYNVAFCDKKGHLYAGTKYPRDFTKLPEFYFDCIIFPIYDLYNEPVGVMARYMGGVSKNKYRNSSASNSFSKGRQLFGLDKAYPYILKEKRVIVVEGLFDQVQLYQQGIKNVVSTMGTTLTVHHIALLSRFASEIIVIPDPDKAGDKFGTKSQKVAGKYISCRYVPLPTSEDPDELVLRIGPAAFKQLLSE